MHFRFTLKYLFFYLVCMYFSKRQVVTHSRCNAKLYRISKRNPLLFWHYKNLLRLYCHSLTCSCLFFLLLAFWKTFIILIFKSVPQKPIQFQTKHMVCPTSILTSICMYRGRNISQKRVCVLSLLICIRVINYHIKLILILTRPLYEKWIKLISAR